MSARLSIVAELTMRLAQYPLFFGKSSGAPQESSWHDNDSASDKDLLFSKGIAGGSDPSTAKLYFRS